MKGLEAAQSAGGGGLRAAYCLTLLSETRRKSPGKRPAGGQRTCCLAAKGAMKGLKAAQGGKSPGKRPAGGQGRREAFNGSLLPNVAFWNQKKRCREATFSRARSPCRWLGSADIYIYIYWLVVWNINFIFPYIGNSNPNWLIFFRGVETTNQYIYIYIHIRVIFWMTSLLSLTGNDG